MTEKTEKAASDRTETVKNMFRDLADRSRSLRDDVLRENERLRFRIQELESDLSTAESYLSNEFDESKKEKDRLRREADKLAEENRD
ncbi:MAG TPA: hypothetical protein VGR00_08965, partial [Thermoanaerobaculia bacterium]|nr:hypothetical protein [Thermoanaerobaculia bacterium]